MKFVVARDKKGQLHFDLSDLKSTEEWLKENADDGDLEIVDSIDAAPIDDPDVNKTLAVLMAMNSVLCDREQLRNALVKVFEIGWRCGARSV